MITTSKVKFVAFSATHIGLNDSRKENQDAFGETDTRYGYVYTVCDGMGGHAGGSEASRIAVDAILDYLRNELQDTALQALHEAITNANRKVFEKGITSPELKGMGSTCVVLLLAPEGYAYLAHVGDSRIYGWQDGQLFHLTKDHSFVQLLVDQGEIQADEAEQHPSRNKILRALGVEENIRPTISSQAIPLSGGMRFLLCTDGLNGMVSDAEIRESMSNADFDQTLADMLISKALNGGGKDNVTLTVVAVEEAPHVGGKLSLFDVRPASQRVALSAVKVSPTTDKSVGKPASLVRYLLLLVPVILLLVYIAIFLKGNDEGRSTEVPSDTLGKAGPNVLVPEIGNSAEEGRSDSSVKLTPDTTDPVNDSSHPKNLDHHDSPLEKNSGHSGKGG